MSDEQSRACGYRKGSSALAPDGVPLWRDGAAPLAIALLPRHLGGACAADRVGQRLDRGVQRRRDHARRTSSFPALLCVVGTLFALWQILLVVMAARRGTRSLFALTAAIAAATALLIGSLLYDRALPALTELWNIQSGDIGLGDLAVTVSPDGRTSMSRALTEAQRGDGAQGAGAAQVGPRSRARGTGRTRLRGLRDLPHDPRRQARDPGRHRLRLGLHHRLPGRRRADHLAQRTIGLPSCELSRHGRRRHVREQPRHPKLPGLQRPADARVRPQGDRHARRLDLGPDARRNCWPAR